MSKFVTTEGFKKETTVELLKKIICGDGDTSKTQFYSKITSSSSSSSECSSHDRNRLSFYKKDPLAANMMKFEESLRSLRLALTKIYGGGIFTRRTKPRCRSRFDLLHEITRLIDHGTACITEGPPRRFLIIDRDSWENAEFNEDTGVCLKDKVTKYTALEPLKISRLVTALTRIHEHIRTGKYKTKRELFYVDQDTYGKQDVCDTIIDDICSNLRLSKIDLHLTAVPKGVVYGDLIIELEDQPRIWCLSSSRVSSVLLFQSQSKPIMIIF